jgi:hypothetical protein
LDGQRSEQSEGSPVAAGSAFPHPYSPWCPTVMAGHVGGHTAFVQKYQTLGMDLAYLLPPGLPPLAPLFAVLFLGVERFFLRLSPYRCNHSPSRDLLSQICLCFCNCRCNSHRVRSGWARTWLRIICCTGSRRREYTTSCFRTGRRSCLCPSMSILTSSRSATERRAVQSWNG